jgi:hypothetical protein
MTVARKILEVTAWKPIYPPLIESGEPGPPESSDHNSSKPLNFDRTA